VRCVWGRPALPTLLMMSWPATRSNFSCWNHRFIVLCSAVNQRNKDPIRPDPDMGPRPSPPSTNQSSNPVNSCHPLSKSKRFKYISPDLGAETRHNCRFVREVRWMENRGKWKWVGVRGSGQQIQIARFNPRVACVCAGPSCFFRRRLFGSNQKITTKLLACHEICLDFVSSPLLLIFFCCLLLLRMQNVLLFYFAFPAPQKEKKSVKCSCALEVVFSNFFGFFVYI